MNLQFSTGRKCTRYNFFELSSVQQNQFLVACKNAWGPKYTLYEAIKTAESEQMIWEYFEITDTNNKQIVYQAWVMADDCATFFTANTAEEIEITMTQSSIYATNESDKKWVELAGEIKSAYKAVNNFNADAFKQHWDAYIKEAQGDTRGKEYWINYFSQFRY